MAEYINEIGFAKELDKNDPLKEYRQLFHIPQMDGKDVIYLCGNSLGLQPKSVRAHIETELKDWETLGVEGHFHGTNPWLSYHKMFAGPVSKLVGAKPEEVVVMNTLTTNLHLMMVSFYRPTPARFKILTEFSPFPSDSYAFESQAKFHGFNPEEAIIELRPKEGEYMLQTEDIIAKINEHKDELALVLLGGVNYYTGQAFDMEAITKAGHYAGSLVGFDLAHAAGNLILKLHDWNVDFAAWCSYKYLNSGPGGVSGVFINKKWANSPEIPRFAGWWGYDEATRFQMKKGFKPAYGAEGWQLSNAQILPMAAHKASLDIFNKATMPALNAKSQLLTGYLEFLIKNNMQKKGEEAYKIITPSDSKQRGAQLSIIAAKNGKEIFNSLTKKGIIADWREPDVIRVAPVPMYNTFEDVWRFAKELV